MLLLLFSDDSSDEWSCSWHSFDEHAFGDDEENWTVQPYQFEPEIDDEEESQEMRVGDDRLEDRRQNTDWLVGPNNLREVLTFSGCLYKN